MRYIFHNLRKVSDKMLKISKVREPKKISINYDAYIPIDIKFGTWDLKQESTTYWRTGDFQNSLIEIGLGDYTKEIRFVTFIMCNHVSQNQTVYRNLVI